MDDYDQNVVLIRDLDPYKIWPNYEKELRSYLGEVLAGNQIKITIHQAEGNMFARRQQGWKEHSVKTKPYVRVPSKGSLERIWAEVLVEVVKHLQSHGMLEIVHVHRHDIEMESMDESDPKPITATWFHVVFDLPPKRRCVTYDRSDDVDIMSSSSSSSDWMAEDLNKGTEYKRKRTVLVVDD